MRKNNQPISKKELDPSGKLAVKDVFSTVQGEGPFAGYPATFVRLAGCNIRCPGCDTDYSGGVIYTPQQLVSIVENMPKNNGLARTDLVVITGGEPLRQNIHPLVTLLHSYGYIVQIETNGTLPYPVELKPDEQGPFIVCSPKTRKVHPRLIPLVDAWKYVVEEGFTNNRGLPVRALHGTKGVWQDFQTGSLVYVQPMDEQNELRNKLNTATAVSSSLMHGYLLCLQMHKFANLP